MIDESQLKKINKSLENIIERRTKELKIANERLSRITMALDHTSDGIGIAQLDRSIIYTNNSFYELTGYTQGELNESGGPEILYKKEVAKEIFTALENGESWSGEVDLIRADGEMREVYLRANSYISDEGHAKGLIGVHTDMTKIRRLEDQLDEFNHRNKMILESITDGFMALDSNWSITYINKKAFEIMTENGRRNSVYGLRENSGKEDVLGVNLWDFFSDYKKTFLYKRFEEVMEKQVEKFFEFYYEPIDKWLNMRIYPLKDGISIYFTDISRRKEIEQKLLLLIRDLEYANKELKDFAYIVSHDLKAPLRSIGSLSDWIIKDYQELLDNDGREMLFLLQNRVNRMSKLIDGILQYSRIGRTKEDFREIDLNALVHEIVSILDVPENISVQVKGKLPKIYFEEVKIQQVLLNLISNAVKYMDKDEGIIEIDSDEGFKYFNISVKDNGMGIDQKYHEKIFKIFQTLHSRDEIDSTGIGLTIVKKIADLYDGFVDIESKEGKGSKFIFNLPKKYLMKEGIYDER